MVLKHPNLIIKDLIKSKNLRRLQTLDLRTSIYFLSYLNLQCLTMIIATNRKISLVKSRLLLFHLHKRDIRLRKQAYTNS
jgi:hypothetical protein